MERLPRCVTKVSHTQKRRDGVYVDYQNAISKAMQTISSDVNNPGEKQDMAVGALARFVIFSRVKSS